MNQQLYEAELAKAEVEHKVPVVVGFYILQYANLRVSELCYNFMDKLCDINKYEELEMDTDFPYLALAELELTEYIRPEMKTEWDKMRSIDCNDSFAADSSRNFFPRTSCTKHQKHNKREPRLFKEDFKFSEMLCICSKTNCCYDLTSNKLKFNSKVLNRLVLEQSGNGPLENYHKVLDDAVIIRSTNRVFRPKDHTVVTYEQTKQAMSYFSPKRMIEDNGGHTHPLNF